MDDELVDKQMLRQELQQLREKHRQLDTEIHALRETGAVDMLKTGRMKKIKLNLKDRIAAIEDSLTPDIIA
jgi:hypothetical protein